MSRIRNKLLLVFLCISLVVLSAGNAYSIDNVINAASYSNMCVQPVSVQQSVSWNITPLTPIQDQHNCPDANCTPGLNCPICVGIECTPGCADASPCTKCTDGGVPPLCNPNCADASCNTCSNGGVPPDCICVDEPCTTCVDEGIPPLCNAGCVNEDISWTWLATPDPGYYFVRWEGDCSGQVSATCTLIQNNCTPREFVLNAVFASLGCTTSADCSTNYTCIGGICVSPSYDDLFVYSIGTGTGIVYGDAPGPTPLQYINCGSNCAAAFDKASYDPVVMTMLPTSGSTFYGWGGDCDGSDASCNITMDTSKIVIAAFGIGGTPPCTTTADCSTNYTCVGGICVPGCGNCPPGYTCKYGICLPNPSGPTGMVIYDCNPDGVYCYDEEKEFPIICTQNVTTVGPDVFSTDAIYGFSYYNVGTSVFPTFKVHEGNSSVGINISMNESVYFTAGGSNVGFEYEGDDVCKVELTVTKSGEGTGTVAGNGIDCGSTCDKTFNRGTVVTLAATPDSSNVFDGWSGGGCSGTGSCVVEMDIATEVDAEFNPLEFLFSVTKSGSGADDGLVEGTADPSGPAIDCGSDCDNLYNEDTIVTLTATPDGDDTFDGWSGSGCSGTGDCEVLIDATKSVDAAFTACDCTGIDIRGNSQMTVGSSQTLDASGSMTGCTYNWEIASGGGSLSTPTGTSTVYTAPATNVNCTSNPTIDMSCGISTEKTKSIAVNGGSGVAGFTATNANTCTESYACTVMATNIYCDGTVSIPYQTSMSKTGTGCTTSSETVTCAEAGALNPGCKVFVPDVGWDYGPCCALWNTFTSSCDSRSVAAKAAGCCPSQLP